MFRSDYLSLRFGVCILSALLLNGCFLKNMRPTANEVTTITTSDGICNYVNPGSPLHPVFICDQKETVVLQIMKERFALNKVNLEKEVLNQLRSLVLASDIDPKHIGNATVEIWVAAPVLKPQEAHLVVVVKGAALSFAVFLPADMRHWDFLSSPAVQLGESGYPSLEIWKTGRVVMASDRSISNADREQLTVALPKSVGVTPGGVARIKSALFTGESIVLDTEHFSEPYVANFVQQTAVGKKYNLRPIWIPATEPDSYKAMGYVFKLRFQG